MTNIFSFNANTTTANNESAWYDNTINETINKSLNATVLNRTEHNYSMEKLFDSRAEADQYLEAVYPGLWKFERNRPTKKGSKGFFHCRVSKTCKAKIYILSQLVGAQVALFKNNIEHVHESSHDQRLFDAREEECCDDLGEFEDYAQNDTALDEEPYDEESGFNENTEEMARKRQRRSNFNRVDVAYSAEESFETRELADQFVRSVDSSLLVLVLFLDKIIQIEIPEKLRLQYPFLNRLFWI